eukprot:768326-Hanusia_phi.AAC.3
MLSTTSSRPCCIAAPERGVRAWRASDRGRYQRFQSSGQAQDDILCLCATTLNEREKVKKEQGDGRKEEERTSSSKRQGGQGGRGESHPTCRGSRNLASKLCTNDISARPELRDQVEKSTEKLTRQNLSTCSRNSMSRSLARSPPPPDSAHAVRDMLLPAASPSEPAREKLASYEEEGEATE